LIDIESEPDSIGTIVPDKTACGGHVDVLQFNFKFSLLTDFISDNMVLKMFSMNCDIDIFGINGQ